MRKIFITFTLALVCGIAAFAVPAERRVTAVTQNDGTTLLITMRGDAFFHTYVTTDGHAVEQGEDGSYYYTTDAGITTMLAHNPDARDAVEQDFVEKNRAAINPSPSNMPHRATPKRVSRSVACTGSPKIPIILVNYTDVKFKSDDPVAVFQEQFNTGTKSALQYFTDNSRGKYTPQFDIIGPVTMANEREYYGGNTSSYKDQNIGTMVVEACQGAEGVTWSDYDNDGNGSVDVVIILYAGVGEAQAYGVVPESIWPCRWNLSSAYYYGRSSSGAITIDGVKINDFAVFNELRGSNESTNQIDGIGTFCHEFSHCLGLPDFYDTGDQDNYGMGSWSLMDYGCYNNNTYTPVGYTSYERHFMNWLPLTTPEENTQYTLDPLNTDSAAAIKITNPNNTSEYYLLENRHKSGWDQYIGGSGLLVIHVDYSSSAWNGNTVNNYSTHQRMTIIPADNILSSATEKNDPFPYNGLDSLTNYSTPAATVFKGSYMSQPITEITKDGKQVSFWYMKREHEVPVMLPADTAAVTETSFRADWTSVDDAESYTLEVLRIDEAVARPKLIEDEDFSTGSTSWTASSGTAWDETEGYLRLGTASKGGFVTSNNIDLSVCKGVVSVVATAKSYGSDSEVPMHIMLIDSTGTTIEDQTFELTSEDADYTAVLQGNESDNNRVRIATTAKAKRIMLKEAKVYTGDASALTAAPAFAPVEEGDDSLRVITGITDTTYTVTNLAEGGIYDYKVKANFTDGSVGLWSNTQRVFLDGEDTPTTIATGDVNADGEVNIADVNALISIILGNSKAEDYAGVADVNGDAEINIADVNAVIAIILGD